MDHIDTTGSDDDAFAVGVLGHATIGRKTLPRRQRMIVAVLALHGDRPIGTERLIDAVWSGNPPGSARQSLQNQIARLRATFGQHVIRTDPAGYRLGGRTDIDVFEAAVHEPLRRSPGAAQVEDLERALAIWRGRPFDDLDDVDGVDGARARLEELHASTEEQLAACRLASGDAATSLSGLAELAAAQPYRERRWALLMTGLHSAGRSTEALDAYSRLCAMLAAELGTAPSPELVLLCAAIEHGGTIDLRCAEEDLTVESGVRDAGCTRRASRQRRACAAA